MHRVALLAPLAFVAACATPREPAAPWPAAEACVRWSPPADLAAIPRGPASSRADE